MENIERKEKNKVSIIVPIYNAEKYLGYCLNSIVSQTYQNIEVILVNDGSTDGSLQICKNYAAVDKRIIILDIPNGGVSNARNCGLKKATGEYIQFVDADDTIKLNMTEKLIELMEVYQSDLVICGFDLITLNSNQEIIENVPFHSRPIGEECVLERKDFKENLCRILWRTCLLEEPVNKLYRRKKITENKIEFDTNISLGEDFCVNIKYFKYCNRCVLVEDRYYRYMQFNKNSLSNRYRDDYFENQIYLIEQFEALIGRYENLKDEERSDLACYIVAKLIKSLKNLFVEDCKLSEIEKKERIAFMINYKNMKNAVKEANYIESGYEWIREDIIYSDVRKIYEKMRNKAID